MIVQRGIVKYGRNTGTLSSDGKRQLIPAGTNAKTSTGEKLNQEALMGLRLLGATVPESGKGGSGGPQIT